MKFFLMEDHELADPNMDGPWCDDETLTRLIEECSEVIQACTKIKRFGPQSHYEDIRNDESLVIEIADVMVTVESIRIPEHLLERAKENKRKKLRGMGIDV